MLAYFKDDPQAVTIHVIKLKKKRMPIEVLAHFFTNRVSHPARITYTYSQLQYGDKQNCKERDGQQNNGKPEKCDAYN